MSRLTEIAWRIRRLWREAATDAEMHYAGYQSWRDHLTAGGSDALAGKRVLEIGCGDRAQMSLLLAADGALVTGLDLDPVALGRRRPRMWLAIARSRGLRSASRVGIRDVLHTFRYWRFLSRLRGRTLPMNKVKVIKGDAADLPFPDATFDIVVSSAVWEHLSDVEAATREVNRVLRPGGVAGIQIALFAALQGSHHPEWHAPDDVNNPRIPAWDHLRAARVDLPTYLNEWREQQFREVLERELHVLTWEDGRLPGRRWLTEEIKIEFADYTERELLLASITAWATRRDPTGGIGVDAR